MKRKEERTVKDRLFSVVIPAYGGRDIWRAAVDSVLAQDYPAIELIFADDCTPGYDVEPVRAYIEENRRENLLRWQVVRHPENMGTVRNFRAAHALCTGHYLTHIAMDDAYCDETVLSRYAAALENKPQDAVGVYAKSVVCDEDLKSLGYVSFDTEMAQRMNDMDADGQLGEIARRCCIHMGATAFVRDEFMALGDFDTDYRLIEDWPFFLHAALAGKRLHYVDFDAIFYRNGGVTDAKFSSRTKKICCMDHIRLHERLILPGLGRLPIVRQMQVYYKYALDRMDMAFIYGRMSEMGAAERTKAYWKYLPMEALAMARRKWRYVIVWLVCMAALLLFGQGAAACALCTLLIAAAGAGAEHVRCRRVRKKLEEGKI